MSRRRKWVIAGVGIVLGAILLVDLWFFLRRGVLVSVINKTQGPITQVRVKYTGGEVSTSLIHEQHAAHWYVRPRGESDLRLSFADSQGKQRDETIDVYMEAGNSGTVSITVRDTGVDAKKDIWMRPYWK